MEERCCSVLLPFTSLVNHSCAPNSYVHRKGTDYVLTAMYPIKKGEEVCTFYLQYG